MSKHPSTRRFHVEIPVRFRDLDPMGHVNNAVYFTYMEVARTAYWQELHHDFSYDVLDFVVGRAECDYVSAAMLRETIRVEVWLSRIGNSSFVLDYELFDEQTDRLVARGKTVQVMIDSGSGRPRPIEPALRERLRSFARHWGASPEERAPGGTASSGAVGCTNQAVENGHDPASRVPRRCALSASLRRRCDPASRVPRASADLGRAPRGTLWVVAILNSL